MRQWAIEHGEDPKLRICLCGYGASDSRAAEHEMPKGWTSVAWTANGGYGNQRKNGENENRFRETLWFSPACLQPRQATLFDGMEEPR